MPRRPATCPSLPCRWRAQRLLAEQEAFKAEAAAVRPGVTGTLRLGMEPTASTTLALPLAAFCAEHPRAGARISSRRSAAELRRRLEAFELDVAIAHFAPDDREGRANRKRGMAASR